MKILFLTPYPEEGASKRFRILQYLPYLKEKGINYTVRPFVFQGFYKVLYKKGYLIKKILYFLISSVYRIFDLFWSTGYDIVFVHRESYPFGPAFLERIVKFLGKKVIFDFDDAIFLPSSSESNIFMERFNRYGKVPEVIALADHVITGNKYLADFAAKYNENVSVIPTSVDTCRYRPPAENGMKAGIVIGWIGSKTTSKFLLPMKDIFKKLLNKYPQLIIRIVGGEIDFWEDERIENVNWMLESEIKTLQGFDIGIMPMPDTKWTRGKCAFKAILYISVGIPCVCSPVGMNNELIMDGKNGFLASSDEEWEEKLSELIESANLRKSIGEKARRTVTEKYSVRASFPEFIKVLEKAAT